VYIDVKHIHDIESKEELDLYTAYYFIKGMVRNGVIYNYYGNKSRASRWLNISIYRLRKSESLLIKHKLAYRHKDNLCLVGIHKLRNENKTKGIIMKMPTKLEYKEVRLWIISHIIQTNNKQQLDCRNLKKGRKKKRFKKSIEIHDYALFGTRWLGNRIGVSHAMANIYLKNLYSLGLIRYKQVKEKIGLTHSSYLPEFINNTIGHLYVCNGCLYVHKGRRVTLTKSYFKNNPNMSF